MTLLRFRTEDDQIIFVAARLIEFRLNEHFGESFSCEFFENAHSGWISFKWRRILFFIDQKLILVLCAPTVIA